MTTFFIAEPKSILSIIKVNPLDNPTEKILLKCEASRNERKRNETREELQKIQERISFSIDQYEYSSRKALELLEESTSNGETHVEVIEDPGQLYEILSDARQRAKYKQKFTVFIIGYEEKCENREKLLRQVEDFFMETKASNITRFADEISSDHDEFDFDDALIAMSNALETTSGALAKLQKLQEDISQVFAVYAAFPNDKKGRKKLEKALLKAQEDCSKLSSSLAGVQDELDQTKEKSKKLQKQLDAKNSEIGRLQRSVEESKLLKETNQSLQIELKDTNELLLKIKQENEKLQKAQLSSTNVSVSPEYLKLRAELESLKTLNDKLSNEHQAREAALISEIETVKENYEAEITELRDKFEEQMKSLMDLDDGDFEDQHSSNEALMDDTMEYPDEPVIEQEIVLHSDTMMNEKISVVQSMDNIALSQETITDTTNGNMEESVQTHTSVSPHIVSEDFISRYEAETIQKQLEDELKETKSKSKKMVTSLKAQLVDQQSKHEAIMHDHKKEIIKLTSQYDVLKTEKEQERSRCEDINTEKEKIECELSQLLLTRDEQAHTIENLQAQLDVLQQQVTLVDTDLGTVSRSVQWETPVHTHSNTPAIANTPVQSVHGMSKMTSCDTAGQENVPELHSDGLPELVSMYEVPLEDGKIMSSELSSTSMSPNVSPILTARRQSHGSELPIAIVNAPTMINEHPIVKECQKVHRSVVQFKNKMIKLLADVGSPQSVTELNSIQEIKDDAHIDNVQTQVTLMQHNLTAMINKIEQVLNEEMHRLANSTKSEVVTVATDENELIKLRVELRNAKDIMKVESQEHHKTLRDLKDANDNLKAEVAYLRKMAAKNQQATSELVMFTRLDSERNSLSLKSALESNKISDDVYSQTIKAMEDYGNISLQQFVNLARQYRHCMVVNQIIHQLEGLNPAKKEAVQERIVQYSQRKSRCLSTELDELRIQKTQLANVLTSTLSEIESDTGVFLIKPIIYGNKNSTRLEPTFRTPSNKMSAPVRYSTDKRWPVVKPRHHHDKDAKSHILHHPKLQQIDGTVNYDPAPNVSNRHTKLQLIDLLHKQRKVTTEVRPEPIVIYGSEPPSRNRRPQPTNTERQWNVDESVAIKPSRNLYDDDNALLKSKTSVLPPINIPSDHVTV